MQPDVVSRYLFHKIKLLADGHRSINCTFDDIDQCGYTDDSQSKGQKWMRRFDPNADGELCKAKIHNDALCAFSK